MQLCICIIDWVILACTCLEHNESSALPCCHVMFCGTATVANLLMLHIVCSPNFSQPWQMHAQSTCTASGFVISPLGERRILTNAHAVANHVVVKVRKHGSAQKFNARVLAVGHEVSCVGACHKWEVRISDCRLFSSLDIVNTESKDRNCALVLLQSIF